MYTSTHIFHASQTKPLPHKLKKRQTHTETEKKKKKKKKKERKRIKLKKSYSTECKNNPTIQNGSSDTDLYTIVADTTM